MADKFTQEEIKEINKKLSFVIDKWAHNLINHILKMASDAGVDVVYMNTSKTQMGNVQNDSKSNYFYESLPRESGFVHEVVNLRGRSETLWSYRFNTKTASVMKLSDREYTINEIPQSYQGAVIKIIGKKPTYTKEELKRVFDIITSRKQEKNGIRSKFFYDWNKVWSGAQRFKDSVNETVVLQKMSSDIRQLILSSPALTSFWNFLLSQTQHFDADTIRFALISKINQKVWVINEIQTDVINKYRALVNSSEDYSRKINIDTLKDLLEGNNRSNWIPKVLENNALKESLLNNSNKIYELCQNDVDINQWIKENHNNELAQFFANNMYKRIFCLG